MTGTIVFKDGHREKIAYYMLDRKATVCDSNPNYYSLYFASDSGLYKMEYIKVWRQGGLREENKFWKLDLLITGKGVGYQYIDTIDHLTFDAPEECIMLEKEENKMTIKPLVNDLILDIIKECQKDGKSGVNLFVNHDGAMNLSINPNSEKNNSETESKSLVINLYIHESDEAKIERLKKEMAKIVADQIVGKTKFGFVDKGV